MGLDEVVGGIIGGGAAGYYAAAALTGPAYPLAVIAGTLAGVYGARSLKSSGKGHGGGGH